MSKLDITDRLSRVAGMKPGQPFPPPGLEDFAGWEVNNWASGMSSMLLEARTEIVEQRKAVRDMVYTGRWLLGISAGLLITCAVLSGMIVGKWL